MHNVLKTLAILATIGMLLVVLAGAVVTKTGSGEGCGANWPLCHDQLIPANPTLETVIEYSHRLVTGVVGMLVLVFSLWTGIKYRKNVEVVLVSSSSIFFLLLQSALGAMAVMYSQTSAILALHFGFSLLSFASVVLLATYVFQLQKSKQLPYLYTTTRMKFGILSLFVYTYIVIYIGAYVRHTGSSLGCDGWPLCNGQWVPELTGQAGVQFIHRLAALFLFLAVTLFLYQAYKKYKNESLLIKSSFWLFMFTLLQVLSGAAVVVTDLHLFPSLLHALFVTILFSILCFVTLYTLRRAN